MNEETKQVVLAALQDYQKWFLNSSDESDIEKVQKIDAAFKEVQKQKRHCSENSLSQAPQSSHLLDLLEACSLLIERLNEFGNIDSVREEAVIEQLEQGIFKVKAFLFPPQASQSTPSKP